MTSTGSGGVGVSDSDSTGSNRVQDLTRWVPVTPTPSVPVQTRPRVLEPPQDGRCQADGCTKPFYILGVDLPGRGQALCGAHFALRARRLASRGSS